MEIVANADNVANAYEVQSTWVSEANHKHFIICLSDIPFKIHVPRSPLFRFINKPNAQVSRRTVTVELGLNYYYPLSAAPALICAHPCGRLH
jgi:hypothetical protein